MLAGTGIELRVDTAPTNHGKQRDQHGNCGGDQRESRNPAPQLHLIIGDTRTHVGFFRIHFGEQRLAQIFIKATGKRSPRAGIRVCRRMTSANWGRRANLGSTDPAATCRSQSQAVAGHLRVGPAHAAVSRCPRAEREPQLVPLQSE